MPDLLALLTDLPGGRRSSRAADDLLGGSGGQAASPSSPASPAPADAPAGASSPAASASAGSPPAAASAGPFPAPATSGSSPSANTGTAGGTAPAGSSAPAAATAPASSPATPVSGPATPGDTTAATRLVPALTVGVAEPGFDGLLVSWNPLAVAEERANARAALGLRLRETIHTRAMQASGAGPLEVLELPEALSADDALEQLSQRPGVKFAEKNWRLQTQATSNDPSVTNGSTWGLYGESSSPANAFGSQAAEAWARGFTGSANVVVGIIDEGSQYNHTDLIGNAGVNPGEISGNGIDDDGNGYVDDLYGWDFFNNDNSTYDGSGDDHGTHVAGTIGAQGGNGLGVAGVSWDVSLLTGKFLGDTGGSTANAIKAVDYFTDLKTRHGLNLVATNNSWGGGGYSQGLYDAINRANNAGILFVAAAGNSSTSNLSYPAAYDLPNVISVASIDSNGALSSFSNYGSTWVDLGAPGGGITSTLPGNTYGTYSGTSMATPHVTGALALMRSAQPTATMAQLKQALLESAAQTASLVGKTATGGRLDVNAAIDRLSQLVNPSPGTPTYAVAAPASANEGTTLNFTISTTNLAVGTPLYWRLAGTGISTGDFVGLSSLQGSVSVGNTGGAVVQTTVAADGLTEGNESLLYDLFSDAGLTTRVAGTTVVLNDTSNASGLILWGTTGNDAITGSGGPDRLAGVSATGTSATAMGAKQVDTLTGQGGADVFGLGDLRGVFYDDRTNNSTLGTSDYALIKDFTPGVDKLQVRAGTSYFYTTSTSGLSLYWDRNNDGVFNTTGKIQDELIAVLQGVTALSGTDLIGV